MLSYSSFEISAVVGSQVVLESDGWDLPEEGRVLWCPCHPCVPNTWLPAWRVVASHTSYLLSEGHIVWQQAWPVKNMFFSIFQRCHVLKSACFGSTLPEAETYLKSLKKLMI